MSTTTEALGAAAANREALDFLRMEGLVTPDDPLALNVERKIEAGQPLSPVEAGILRHGITRDTLNFVAQYQAALLH
ncbi:MAG TPA: hypothetical protein VMD92_07775 [Acidobacteriaceae bacterium]|nr:hypothetical protein [Acidobacteriaceae bacterium]